MVPTGNGYEPIPSNIGRSPFADNGFVALQTAVDRAIVALIPSISPSPSNSTEELEMAFLWSIFPLSSSQANSKKVIGRITTIQPILAILVTVSFLAIIYSLVTDFVR